MDDLSSIRVSPVFQFSLALIAVINGQANRSLTQIGAKKKRGRDARMLSS